MNYPHWIYQNKDGTRNKVRVNNAIICEKSKFFVENFIITSNNPAYMIVLINNFRSNNPNITVKMSREENEKYKMLYKEKYINLSTKNIQGILSTFHDKPTDFEKFIADIYEKMEYSVKVTPPTNDGGYDVEICKDKKRSIIECKCFSQSNNVGRPAIQKLVGANSIKKADEMIFITTSDFSNEAKDYANKVGVKLINGKELIKMIVTVNNSEENLIVAESEWSLNFDDLKKYIPKDINVSIEYKKSNITLMNTME